MQVSVVCHNTIVFARPAGHRKKKSLLSFVGVRRRPPKAFAEITAKAAFEDVLWVSFKIQTLAGSWGLDPPKESQGRISIASATKQFSMTSGWSSFQVVGFRVLV